MLQFLETGKALYVLAAICLMGIASRLVARSLYKRLLKETDNMTLTKNQYLRDLKQRTENTYRLNQGIKNTQAYLEKQLAAYQAGHISLNGWGNLSGQLTILCFLIGGMAAFASYWYRCDNYYIVLYGTMGAVTALLTMVVDYGVNLSEKKQQLLCALQDYMENSLFNRLSRELDSISGESEKESKDASRSGVRETIRSINQRTVKEQVPVKEPVSDPQPARRLNRGRKMPEPVMEVMPQKDIDYLKKSLEQIAASREKSRTDGEWVKDLTPEELKLVSEILQEYLS